MWVAHRSPGTTCVSEGLEGTYRERAAGAHRAVAAHASVSVARETHEPASSQCDFSNPVRPRHRAESCGLGSRTTCASDARQDKKPSIAGRLKGASRYRN